MLNRLHVFLVLTAVAPLFTVASQDTTSAIRDIVYTPAGEPFSGQVKVVPEHFEALNPPALSFTVHDGMLDLKVIPCPADTEAVYSVTFTSSASAEHWVETWRVPVGNHLALRDVRLNQRVSASRDGTSDRKTERDISLPIPISGVTNLSSDLNAFNNSVAALTSQEQSLSLIVQSLTSQVVVRGEVPVGSVDGHNATFSLAHVPAPNTLEIFVNGVRLSNPVDFTLPANSSTFTIVSGSVPPSGANFQADYRYAGTSQTAQSARSVSLPIPINDVNGLTAALNSISNNLSTLTQQLTSLQSSVLASSCPHLNVGLSLGSPNGQTVSFLLPSNSIIANQVAIYRHGLRLMAGGDYTFIGSTVTFLTGGVPSSGDNVLADFCSQQ